MSRTGACLALGSTGHFSFTRAAVTAVLPVSSEQPGWSLPAPWPKALSHRGRGSRRCCVSFPQQQTIPSRGPTPLKEALPGPGPAYFFPVSTREEGLPGGTDPLVCVWPPDTHTLVRAHTQPFYPLSYIFGCIPLTCFYGVYCFFPLYVPDEPVLTFALLGEVRLSEFHTSWLPGNLISLMGSGKLTVTNFFSLLS